MMVRYRSRFPLVQIVIVGLILALPAGVSAASTVCFSCHKKENFTDTYVHQPLKKGECGSCHNPHVAHFKGLLDEKGAELCYKCHQDAQKKFAQDLVHQPVRRGECLSCHEPHASGSRGLLRHGLKSTCFSCHTTLQEKYKYTHSPYTKGQCSSCHRPHQSEHALLLKFEGETLCFSCHQGDALRKGHPNYPGRLRDCLSCHNPHGSSRKGIIRDVLHAPYAKGCGDCHAKGKKQVGTEVCLGCHGEVAEKTFMSHTHLSGKAVNKCVACHSPHAADEKTLLKGSQAQVCMGCHEDTRVRYEDTLYKHSGAETCTECHDVHGSNLLVMLKGDGNGICTRCHETQGKFTHPIGEKVIDPRTGGMVSCVTCHTPMGSDYKYELKLSGAKDLCVQCHKSY